MSGVVSKKKWIMDDKGKSEKILDLVKNNPIENLNDIPNHIIQEFIGELEKKGDMKTADGKSTLVVLTQELEKRKEEVK